MRSFLIFMLHNACYGLDAAAIREIIPLPELTPVAEAPSHIAGLLNLRGEVLAVLDLDARLGLPPHRPRPGDIVVVAQFEGVTFGMIVDEVREVLAVSDAALGPVPAYAGDAEPRTRFITAMARLGEEIVAILGVDRLVRYAGLAGPQGGEPAPHMPRFAPDSSDDERGVFRERAAALLAPLRSVVPEGLLPIALFRLGGEYFGVRLELVREFAEVRDVTRIPCCPGHIIGQMNLRGDILTLVDIRGAIGMPVDGRIAIGNAIVVQIDGRRAGIVADEVLDVIERAIEDLSSVPVALRSAAIRHVTGVARYGPKIFSMLDVGTIFASGALDVDEQVG